MKIAQNMIQTDIAGTSTKELLVRILKFKIILPYAVEFSHGKILV